MPTWLHLLWNTAKGSTEPWGCAAHPVPALALPAALAHRGSTGFILEGSGLRELLLAAAVDLGGLRVSAASVLTSPDP